MELIHAIVHHNTFGQGKVMQIKDDVVSISFDKPYGRKKFLFPAAFVQHLKLEDESLRSEMKEVLRQNQATISAELERTERSDRIARFRANSIEQSQKALKQKKK